MHCACALSSQLLKRSFLSGQRQSEHHQNITNYEPHLLQGGWIKEVSFLSKLTELPPSSRWLDQRSELSRKAYGVEVGVEEAPQKTRARKPSPIQITFETAIQIPFETSSARISNPFMHCACALSSQLLKRSFLSGQRQSEQHQNITNYEPHLLQGGWIKEVSFLSKLTELPSHLPSGHEAARPS